MKIIKAGPLRKQSLRQRADRYREKCASFSDAGLGWQDGYKAALKDVRKAAGKAGIPSRLVKLLRPMR